MGLAHAAAISHFLNPKSYFLNASARPARTFS
jgi:hypothetical protein